MKRSLISAGWALALSLAALSLAAQPAPSPEEVAHRFSDAFTYYAYSADTEDLEALLDEPSRDAVELHREEVLEPLRIWMFYPALQPQEVRTEGARATVRTALVIRELDLKLAQEQGVWKVDLLGTLEGLPGHLRPEIETPVQLRCLVRLSRLARALVQYAWAHDERLPRAEGWMDAIRPYLEDEEAFRCPGAPEMEYGHAFNTALSGKLLDDIANMWGTVVVFDCQHSRKNAAGGPEAVAAPARHGEAGNGYVFVDGSAFLYPGGETPNFDPTQTWEDDEPVG